MYFGLAALTCFLIAAAIDMPYPNAPTPYFRNYGNFFCSLGFVFLTLMLLFKR
jgi:hypothetical protein